MAGCLYPVCLVLALLLVSSESAVDDSGTPQRYSGRDTGSHRHQYSASYHQPLHRDDRRLIFVNNKAYDLSEEEQTRVWDLYLKKGYVPDTQGLDHTSEKNPLLVTVMSPVAAIPDVQNSVQEGRQGDGMVSLAVDPDNKVSRRIFAQEYPVKSSRFVADPEKVVLIEEVDGEELEELQAQQTTVTTESSERVATEASVDTSTVHYEATQVNALTFIWQEVWNFGELLGRELFGTVTNRIRYLWRSFVKFVQSRVRRAIPDLSTEL